MALTNLELHFDHHVNGITKLPESCSIRPHISLAMHASNPVVTWKSQHMVSAAQVSCMHHEAKKASNSRICPVCCHIQTNLTPV